MDRLKHLHTVHAAENSPHDGYIVNWSAYERYLEENYPNLHCPEFHKLPNAEKDNLLHNPVDVAMYNGTYSPDNVWDSIARSLYGMGYLGVYAKTAAMLESGRNYLFDFTEFAHVYPCLRSMHGDAFKLRDLNCENMVGNETEKPSKEEYYHFSYKRGMKFPKLNQRIPCKEFDVELERRSTFNEALIYRIYDRNPKGTLWTHLTADKEKMVLENSFDWEYGVEPPSAKIRHNKNYIYEKFVFCTAKHCPGIMRIILDCIHKVVIVSMFNPHFDCWETHKRRIFDVVRKLIVLHGADLDYIDTKYLSIPRRFGLTYVESWVNTEEYTRFKKSEYTPSYFCYSHTAHSNPWSQTKNRNWMNDIYNESNEEIVTMKREREIEGKKNPMIARDLNNYAIKTWKAAPFRKNEFGNVIIRNEYEFHIEQFINEKMREIYRVWRIIYFETTDKMRTLSKIYQDSMIRSSQLYLTLSGNTNNLFFSHSLPHKYWESIIVKMAGRYTHSGPFILCSLLHIIKTPIIDPAILIPSYPSNLDIGDPAKLSNENLIDNDNYIIINATLDELANCEDMYITQRFMDFEYANLNRSGIIEKSGSRKDWKYYFESLFSRKFNNDEFFKSNRIFDDFYKPHPEDYGDITIDNTVKKLQFLKRVYSKYKINGVAGCMLPMTKLHYKLSQVKFIQSGKIFDAFIIHPKLLHETTFLEDLMRMRRMNNVLKVTILEFPMYDVREKRNYSNLFDSPEKKDTAGLNERINNAISKLDIEVIIVQTPEIIPIEIINTVYGICVTNNREISIVDKMIKNLDSRYPPKRFTDLQTFLLYIDNMFVGSTTAFTRLKLDRIKKMIETFITNEGNEPSCGKLETGDGFILKDDIIKHSIGQYVIYRSRKEYKDEECKRIWKFINLYHHDYDSKKFELLFKDLKLVNNNRPRDMIDTIERIRRRMQNDKV